MSAADEHRASVTQLLNDFTEQRIGASPALELASAATAYALLAIEARLGELVEQQRIANVLAAFHGRGSAYYLDDDGIDHDTVVAYLVRQMRSIVTEATS